MVKYGARPQNYKTSICGVPFIQAASLRFFVSLGNIPHKIWTTLLRTQLNIPKWKIVIQESIKGVCGLTFFPNDHILFRGFIYQRELLAQTNPSVANTKAWTGHRNWNGVPLSTWDAFVIVSHVIQVLARFLHILSALVSLLFFISGDWLE